MRILVSGANGFIGKYLVAHLKKAYPTAALLPVGLGKSELPNFQTCDFSNRHAVALLVSDFKPTHAFHLVGISRVQEHLGIPQYFTQNYLTTLHLVEALVALKSPSRLFFSSSMHVYGNQNELATETLHPKPGSAYAFTKYIAEQMVRSYAIQNSHFRAVIGRLYSCFGPNQPEGFVTADFCKRVATLKQNGETTLKVGPLSPIRRFIDVRDLVEIMPRLLLEDSDERYQLFNIASPHERSIGDLLTALLQIAAVSPKIESSEQTTNPFKGLAVSIEKLSRALPGLVFRPVETTLRDMWKEASHKSS